ncbi:MAG: hypothetical protein QOI48_3001 [Solirubrobacteraceae bacterium]|jgi:hypothetical protein|nr:hypothetical protein [Solirubrobacteraceae bacterium]
MWGKRYFNFPGSQHERLCAWTGRQGPPETDIVAELTENTARATAIVDKQIYSLFTRDASELVHATDGPTSTFAASQPKAAY